MFVIDSNVFAKLFIDEADSSLANDFFRHCIEQDVALLAPTLFQYEVLQIALYYQHPLDDALQRLKQYCHFNLELVALESDCWLTVERIVQSGHQKSGFPSLYDSCYHALAIERGMTFITADKRHKAKTEAFGQILLLDEWNAATFTG